MSAAKEERRKLKKEEKEKALMEKRSHQIYIWLDGAYEAGKGSWYAIIQYPNGQVEEMGKLLSREIDGREEESPFGGTSKILTNNRAECIGLIDLLSLIVVANKGHKKILVITDSQYCQWGLLKVGGNETNKDIWSKVWQIIKENNLEVECEWQRRGSSQENIKCDVEGAKLIHGKDYVRDPKKFADIWKNQTQISNVFHISAVEVGNILRKHGLKSQDGDGTEKAVREGFAHNILYKGNVPFALWNVDKVSALIKEEIKI